MSNLTIERLKSQLDYNPLTGLFIWKVTRHRIVKGDLAGSINSKGYVIIRLDGEHHKAHRLAWFYVYGMWPSEVDHKDGIKSNNAILNLRDGSHNDNMQNQMKPKSTTKTGFLGVSFDKRLSKYKAQIRTNGINNYLGVFDTPEEAHTAYVKAKRKQHATCMI